MRTGEPIRQTSLPWAQNHEFPCFEGRRSCILGGVVKISSPKDSNSPCLVPQSFGIRVSDVGMLV